MVDVRQQWSAEWEHREEECREIGDVAAVTDVEAEEDVEVDRVTGEQVRNAARPLSDTLERGRSLDVCSIATSVAQDLGRSLKRASTARPGHHPDARYRAPW